MIDDDDNGNLHQSRQTTSHYCDQGPRVMDVLGYWQRRSHCSDATTDGNLIKNGWLPAPSFVYHIALAVMDEKERRSSYLHCRLIVKRLVILISFHLTRSLYPNEIEWCRHRTCNLLYLGTFLRMQVQRSRITSLYCTFFFLPSSYAQLMLSAHPVVVADVAKHLSHAW